MAEMYKGVSKKAVVQILENVMDTADKAGESISKLERELLVARQRSYDEESERNRMAHVIIVNNLEITELEQKNTELATQLASQVMDVVTIDHLKAEHSRIESNLKASNDVLRAKHNMALEDIKGWQKRYNTLLNKTKEQG